MPLDPGCKCKVINGKTGHSRDNFSWILGRIVRDFDFWMHDDVRKKLDEVLDERHKTTKRPPMAGLIVSIYTPSTKVQAGTVKCDHVYWIGLPIMAFQLGIAAIPCGIFGDWGSLLITSAGIALSITTGLLPQWKRENWACREGAVHDYILTRGNGSQHAIIILGTGRGFNLEDLASGQANLVVATNNFTRITLLVLAILWILLLITAAGLNGNSWFLLAIGGIGIVQNIYVAGASRHPENFGIPLDFSEVFGNPSVMETLLEVEKKHETLGHALLDEFFPRALGKGEERRWRDLKEYHALKKRYKWRDIEECFHANQEPKTKGHKLEL
jgi:hypothetical protein